MIVKTKPCIGCGGTSQVEVTESAYRAWQEGAHVQDAFPELSADERERLLSGTCPICWDKMFPEEEEDDP